MNRYTTAFRRLLVQLEPICKKYGKSRYWFLFDALGAFIRYGVTPNEYIGFSFYKLSTLERKQYYTARHSKRYDKRLLRLDCRDAFENKVETNKMFSKFVHRDWLFAADATLEEVERFLAKHAKIIVKPINMAQGKGVHIYKGESASELKGMGCLLEDFVVQHKDLAVLNPSSVNTIRVYTLVFSVLSPPRCWEFPVRSYNG